MAFDAETRLVNALIRADRKTVKVFFEHKINPPLMQERGKELNFVLTYYADHRKMPSRTAVKENFPAFPLFQPKDTLEYLCKTIVAREIKNTVQTMGEELGDSLDDVEKVKQIVTATSLKLNTELSQARDVNWIADTRRRTADYLAREKAQGRLGVATPWASLTDMLLGWQKEHLITVVARPYVGKTWFMLLCALKAWEEGYRPLLVTKEMSTYEIEQRLDAAYLKIAYPSLRRGCLTGKDRIRYMRLSKVFKDKRDLIISGEDDSGSRGGVSSLSAKIREFSPDIALVDGAYLLEDDRGADSITAKLYNITRDLKRLARREGIPLIQSVQMGRGGEKKGGGKLSQIQWSDSYSQDSDEVVEIVGDPKVDFRRVKILKQRNGGTGEMTIRFDMTKMDFSVIDATSTGGGEASDDDKEYS